MKERIVFVEVGCIATDPSRRYWKRGYVPAALRRDIARPMMDSQECHAYASARFSKAVFRRPT